MTEDKASWRRPVALAATLVVLGCSSGSQPGGSNPKVSEDALPDQGAATVCDGLGACCRTAGFAFDDANCRNVWRATFAAVAPTSYELGASARHERRLLHG